MRSIGNPETWVPYMNTKDCSQGLCSLYCPQWCYIIFPPPPPPMEFPDDDDSGPNFSPFVIAIISILASALLLVSYYIIISKYCGNMDSTRRRENHDTAEAVLDEDDHNPSTHEPWQTSTTGLDESLIKSITIFKYKKGDGLIEGTDCSVCLSEFQEDDSLRLLPKCSHGFHVHCIDTWLRSHSNCPLCRANTISVGAPPLGLTPPMTESPPENASLPDRQPVRNENAAAAQNVQEVGRSQSDLGGLPKTTSRAFSDLGNVQRRDTIIEIRGEGYEQMRRSVSMDHLCENQLSVADILHMNQEEDNRVEECRLSSGIAGPSKQSAEASEISNKMRVLHCVINRVAMKRSISSSLINIAF